LIKKFSYVFLLTLISQIISLLSLSYVVKRNATDSFLEFVALLDSSYLLLNTVLSFGIIQIATREIVLAEKWEKVVADTQNIRLNFSVFLLFFGIVLLLITKNYYFLVFLFSPLIALNVNYLFYAKGKSQVAIKNASIRSIILSFSLIFLGFFEYFSNKIYFVLFVLGLIYVAVASNYESQTKIKYKINTNFFRKYSKSIWIGITDLAIIFLEFGILFFASFFYSDTVVAEAYILIKIITIVKGFQRMIFQVFYDQLIQKAKAFLLDQVIFFIGFSFFVISFFFSKEIFQILYSKNNTIFQENALFLSIALLIASFILASTARTLIVKKDKIYIRSYLLSFALSFITMVVMSYSKSNNYGISIALLVGEFALFLSFFFGIYKDIDVKKYIINFLKYCFLFFTYYCISKFIKAHVFFLIILVFQISIAAIFLFINRKQFDK
jgi:hypothetical protein